jgi:ABC-2 type transport system ATP-binding protein
LPEIAAHGLVKRFGCATALAGIDLELPAGSLWAVVGPDGAGKTTLLRCLVGLCRPDAGTVVPGEAGRMQVGFAPQGFHLYGELTVEENIQFFGGVYGLSRDALAERSRELLEFAGLAQHRSRPAGDLSGGMKQKLNLVCSLLHRPRVLLLDEPTTGVDPVSRREFWELIELLLAGGSTILLTSAYFDEVERCQRVVFLHQGSVLACGTPAELRGVHANLEEAFLAVMP